MIWHIGIAVVIVEAITLPFVWLGAKEILKEQDEKVAEPLKVGVYRHYKGDFYLVLGVGEHTETGERLAVYVSLSNRPGCRLRIRPLRGKEGFFTPTDDGRDRFVYVGDEIPSEDRER